jgi:hypothetical protein
MPSDTDLFLFGRTEGEKSDAAPAAAGNTSEAPGAGDTLSQGQGGLAGPYGYITE